MGKKEKAKEDTQPEGRRCREAWRRTREGLIEKKWRVMGKRPGSRRAKESRKSR